MLYFNEIDKVINSLNDSNNTTLSLANNYFDNINKLTSEKIDELTNNFKNQIETVKTIYSKNNLPTEDLEKYNSLLATINSDSKLLLKKQGGNKKYRKYNK
jgi:DNA-binding protein H-NS